VRRLGRDRLAAVGLWELAGTWCCDNIETNLADGFVPKAFVDQEDPKHRHAKRLVDVGLWEVAEVDGEPGYLFHDWADYNTTREAVLAERETWRAKKAAQRKAKPSTGRVSPRDTPETPNGNPTESPPRFPDPFPFPIPSGGSVGREGPAGSRARDEPPPPRCPRHIEQPTDQPCRACGDARKALERWDAEQAEQRADLARQLEQARADPRQRCEHGTDGGRFIRPDTGESPCALCRSEATQRKAPA
jgi:hypothetical protein